MKKHTTEINNIGWNFDNTYARLPEMMMSKVIPIQVKKSELVIINHNLSNELGLNFSNFDDDSLASLFSGNSLPEKSECIAQAYAGHQFGHFTMLGDGRAIMIGEHITKKNKRFDIQFKGSGITPYSRNGDGRAALGPMLREYIISEAMYKLKIPTTRSLAVVKTGENVIRENILQGAILTRVAASHLRVGTFQYVAMQNDLDLLKTLINYTIERHYPNIKNENNTAISLLKIVMKNQIDLITNWMRVGFIHGVMNTDNMTISGETIDYGPCAFMDTYDPQTVFSSIDEQGRYAYFNQPDIAKWNLTRFAECLLPLIDKNKDKAIQIATETINNFAKLYKKSWLDMMHNKLGLLGNDSNDENLIIDLLAWMHQNKADYTNTFCFLMKKNIRKNEIYKDESFLNWKLKWEERLKLNSNSPDKSLNLMCSSNPLIIPRNHNIEEVLDSATIKKDLKPMKDLLKILEDPYKDHANISKYQLPPAQDNKNYKTFCGT